MSVHALIKHSIAKWQKVSEIPKEDFSNFCKAFDSNGSCSLCNAFRKDKVSSVSCQYCPICVKTGFASCAKTPISNIELALDYYNFNDFKIHSKEEVVFLKHVLAVTPERHVEGFEDALKKTDKAIESMFREMEDLNEENEK